jgi:hypothetical protein
MTPIQTQSQSESGSPPPPRKAHTIDRMTLFFYRRSSLEAVKTSSNNTSSKQTSAFTRPALKPSSSESSERSTVSAHRQPVKESTRIATAANKASCRVRFFEAANKYYQSAPFDRDNLHNVWYTREESKDIKEEVGRVARLLHSVNQNTEESWIHCLDKTYTELCVVQSVNDLEVLLTDPPKTTTANFTAFLGFEKLLLRNIDKRRRRRRTNMHQQIQACQHEENHTSQDSLAKRLRRISRKTSGPDRMFACYLANANHLFE